MTATRLKLIPLDRIDVVAGHNPRARVELDDEFVASVRANGILTPILVRAVGSGADVRYDLVAGERRFRAALLVGLEEIPAAIRSDAALPAALVENMQRQGLSPIEEAQAFDRAIEGGLAPKKLAEELGVPASRVTARLQLLELPVTAQSHVEAGAVSLQDAVTLRKFAPLGEAMVAGVADALANDNRITSAQLKNSTDWVVRLVVGQLGAKAPFVVSVRKGVPVGLTGHSAPTWPEGCGIGAVSEALKGLPDQWDQQTYAYPRQRALAISQADIDAAKVFGCLVDLGGEHYVTDPVWLADRLLSKVEKAVKAWERKQAKAKTEKGGDVDSAAKEAARSERALILAGQISARERNISLRQSFLELQAQPPPVTVEAVQALGELLLVYAGDDLGDVWRFVDERAETVKTKKSGDISTLTYSRGEGGGPIISALRKASTPEAAMAVLLQALIAARFADKGAARPSDRFGGPRGFAIDGYGTANTNLVGLIDRVANPFLPADVRLQVKERLEAAAAEREQRRQVLLEDYGDLPARVRAGESECPHCGALSIDEREESAEAPAEPFVACACTDEQIIEAAVECPSCGEESCFASCAGFVPPAAAEVAA